MADLGHMATGSRPRACFRLAVSLPKAGGRDHFLSPAEQLIFMVQITMMNKQKQTEIKGFLGWLESYLGANVEDLTPKTAARRATTSTITKAYWRCSRRTEKMMAIDPACREPEPRAEFEGSVSKLLPLLERTLADG